MRAILFLAAVLLTAGAAQAAPLRVISQGPVAGGRQYVVHSEKAGRDFRIQVSAPVRLPAGRRAPAVYVLDGDSNFAKVTAAARVLASSNRAGPAYVVAVGYPEGVAEQARLVDLVHVKAAYKGGEIGGGGAAFEGFLTRELRPFIEARYRIDRRRSVLMGHSVGGLFTATVMLHAPRVFGGYVIASPSLQFDPGLIARARVARGGGQAVYIAVGGEEGPLVDLASELGAALARPGSGFMTRQKTFAGEDHMSVIPVMLTPSLAFVLPRGRTPTGRN